MKKFISFVLILTLIFSFLAFAGDSDSSARTTPSEWAKNDVESALELGIVNAGKTTYYGSFIKREEFCELVYNLVVKTNTASMLESDENNYTISDTKNTSVEFLVDRNILNGKENIESKLKFCPHDFLTREETAVIFNRLISKVGCDIVYTDSLIEYDDDKDVSKWAIGAVQFVSKTGLMSGFNNVFYPKSHLTTEEAVSVIMRAYDVIERTKPVNEKVSFADKINSLMPNDENYLLSPMSIKMALALAANGAEGETKNEIISALGIENLDEYNEKSKDLLALYTKTDKLQINIANSVWLNESNADGVFTDTYKSTVSNFFGAQVKTVNNQNAASEINGWVNKKTNGKIPSIRNDANFWVSLINAVYFKGLWQNEFYENMTKDDIFTDADSSQNKVPFMNKTTWLQYTETENTRIITLPYKNNFFIDNGDGNYLRENFNDIKANMHFILSDGSINVEDVLYSSSGERKYIKLSLPKFNFEYSTELGGILTKLGINKAFSPQNADFTKMFTGSNMWLDSVIHKTFISVDEKGTEAAAVTEVAMAGSSLPPEPIEVKFDKPFYFAIEVNGDILFMGRYAYTK